MKATTVLSLLLAISFISCGDRPDDPIPEEQWVTIETSHTMDKDDSPWKVTPKFSNDDTRKLSFEWNSSDTDVAIVRMNADKSAIVTPLASGTTVITIKCKTITDITAQCELTITRRSGLEVENDDIDGWGKGNEDGENVNTITNPPRVDEPSHIDITTTFEGVMAAFSLAGSGSATIDWGDGSGKETVELKTLEITGRDLAVKHRIPHTYAAGSGTKTITVTGDNITGIDTGSTFRATAIDIQNMPTIRFVACEREKLTSLDVSNVTSLTHLMCLYNAIVSLNVTGCTALVDMNVQDNKYKTIVGLNTLTALTFANASRTLMDVGDIRAAFAALPDRTGKSQGTIFFYGAGNADYPQCPGWPEITEEDKKVATNKNWKLQ